MPIKAIALDLEATLVTNVINRRARPGLNSFLRFCLDHFEKVVIFSGSSYDHVRSTLEELEEERLIPDDFLQRTEIIEWDGWYKDLKWIQGYEPEEILIVDDFVDYIKPEQKSQWIRIKPYFAGDNEAWIKHRAHAPEITDRDRDLARVQREIRRRMG